MTLFHAECCGAHLFDEHTFGQFGLFPGHSHTSGCMDCQLFGIVDEVNAQAGLSNEPRNVPCATGRVPPPPSRDRHFSIGAFWHLWAYGDAFKSILRPKVRCKRPTIAQPHAPSTWESGGTSWTYYLAPQSAGLHFDCHG